MAQVEGRASGAAATRKEHAAMPSGRQPQKHQGRSVTMKKVAYVIGGIVVLIIVVALVAPFFVDLNNYKPQIEAQAKAATGRDLKIEGPISLSLLPLPSVSVQGVKFGNAPGG